MAATEESRRLQGSSALERGSEVFLNLKQCEIMLILNTSNAFNWKMATSSTTHLLVKSHNDCFTVAHEGGNKANCTRQLI